MIDVRCAMKRLSAATLALVRPRVRGLGARRQQPGIVREHRSRTSARPSTSSSSTTVSTNMVQLGYWSDALSSRDVDARGRRRAGPLGGRPGLGDRSGGPHAARDARPARLDVPRVLEGRRASLRRAATRREHMANAWRLANASHKLLAGAKARSRRAGLRRVAARSAPRTVTIVLTRAPRTGRGAHPPARADRARRRGHLPRLRRRRLTCLWHVLRALGYASRRCT